MMIKRFIFPAILLAVLSAAAVSCVKDETVDSVGIQSEIGFDAAVSVDTTWTLSTKSSFIATDSADSLVIGEEVTLNRNSASYAATKGTVITGIDTYGSFATFAYTYAAADSWANVKSGSAPDFMYNLKSEKISGQWRPNDRLYYWPAASYKLSFFAYTPYTDYKADGTNPVSDYMSVSSASATGAPVIDYSVPSALDRQIDLMTASKTDVSGGFHQPVPMDFRHVLSGVRFTAKTKGLNITIKSVTITNVRDRGSLALDSDNWILSPDGSKSDFSLVKDVAVGGSSVAVNGPTEGVFFMLPQILPDGSKLEVVYTKEGGEEVTVTADFKGKSWEMGRMYTYNLTIGDSDVSYVLTVTPKSLPDDVGNLSNKAVYTIVSTKTTDYGGSSYVEDIPYTISGLPADVTYEINADGTVTITAPKRTGTITTILCGSSVIMRDRPELGSEAAPIDLTTGDAKNGSRGETANCYVLNNAGWYCFPADVMGIGNSGLMYDATYSKKNQILKSGFFIDYKNNTLTTSAAISTSGCTPVLLWEDSKGFINDLKLSSDGYISFKTSSKDDIVPSNAVIALRGSDGKIRWSWHIWCTIPTGTYTYISSATGEEVTADYAGASMVSDGGAKTDAGYVYNTGRYKTVLESYQKKDSTWVAEIGEWRKVNKKWVWVVIEPAHWEYSYSTDYRNTIKATATTTKILAVNIGTVERDRSYTHYYRREFSFTVTQDVTNATAQEVVIQKDRDAVINPAGYSNTLYQWGRKDPFISGKISTFTDDNTGTYYNSSYPDGTNSFEDNASASNETDGVFGTYGVQDNGSVFYGSYNFFGQWVESDDIDVDSDYSVNLQFAINHPMTLITNNYELDYKANPTTTYIDWFTHGIDNVSNADLDDMSSSTFRRYDNSCLWGSIYSDHEYQYASTKTIYDPSPAGYKVAVGYCYSSDYFTKTGVFDYGNYTNVGFFPATGTRSSKTGQLANMGTRGDFWAASVRYILYGLDTSCGITNSSYEFGHSYEQDSFSRGEALSVRPVGSDY